MIEVRQTAAFREWLGELRDGIAVKAVRRRLARVQVGLFGDAKSASGLVHELRIDHGPGYRVYFAGRGEVVILLLCGGAKGSQARDLARARALAEAWKEEDR